MSAPTRPPHEGHFPMPVRHFLTHAQQYLQRGDVVLLKGKATIYSWAVRWWTKSEFSHAALVFSVPSSEDGFERTFLIEASIDGVDITDLRHYARDLSLVYDVAIKRCEQPWMTIDVQRSIRGHMLNYIKAHYDYWTILGIIRGFLRWERHATTQSPVSRSRLLWRRQPPTRFVCSGFVQYGFLSSITRLVQARQLPREAIEQVLFKPGLEADAEPSVILTTTPEDLAASDRLTWKFAVRRGLVHRVGTYDEVRTIFAAT